MSLIPNNLADVVESLVCNTLIPSCLELLDDDEEEDDDDNDDDDLSPMPVENEEANFTC
jgi:hypothetical protein